MILLFPHYINYSLITIKKNPQFASKMQNRIYINFIKKHNLPLLKHDL